MAAAALVAALLGGGKWYYTSSEHRDLMGSEMLELKRRFLDLENDLIHGVQRGRDRLLDKVRRGKERLKMRKDKVTAKMRELLRRFDRNSDGRLDSKEVDLDGDGAVDSDDISAIVADIVDDTVSENERPWFLSKEYLFLYSLLDVAVISLGMITFYLWRKEPAIHVNPKGILKIEIVSAEGMMNVDSGKNGNVSDPYAIASVYTAGKIQTQIVKDDLNPVWNKMGTVHVDCSKEKQRTLSIEVFDGKDGFFDLNECKSLGSAELDITATFRSRAGEHVKQTLHLHGGHEGRAQGTVTIAGTFIPDPLPRAKRS
eukprot:TRINITY_DN29956_c0_g1_i1.p1 TRINITY_DN29956_c0_g1~~TRINITY_DN29956_c0_g1_i1.p1  ORF type:complete len:348 (+),score=48.39 TRINITY_DN29956_c0_g1_i1:104-1045(+)